MTGGPHIRAVGPEGAQDAEDQAPDSFQEEPLALEEEWEEPWEEEAPTSSLGLSWLMPALACLAIAAWTGFYAWAFWPAMVSGGTAVEWIGWIVNWTVPVLLITTAWLLGMRHSRREAGRFADAASLLSREASELETRLVTINRELSLAREFLSSQSLELESLGRVASERLSTHAGELQGLIHSNGAQVDAIATVSDTALTNMQKLRDDLPVIANSARDVSNQVGNAGRTAHEQVDKLISGFERLNEFGKASEVQVNALSGKVKRTLDTFENQVEALDALAEERFGALKEKSEEFRADLDSREVDALAAMRHRADELKAGIASLRSEVEAQEEQGLTALNTRIEAIRDQSESLGSVLREAEEKAFAALSEAKDRLNAEIVSVISDLDKLDEQAVAASQQRVRSLKEEAGRFDDLLAARDIKFNEEIARRQDAFDTRESQATEVLAQRLAELDESLAERRDAQVAETQRLAAHGEAIATKVSELNALFESVSSHAEHAEQVLENGLGQLSGRLEEGRKNLDETGETLGTLTEASIRLLEIIQSGAKQSRDDLPQAIASASTSLAEVEERAVTLRGSMEESSRHGSDLSAYLVNTQADIDKAKGAVEELNARVVVQSDDNLARIKSLSAAMAALERDGANLSEHTRTELKGSIDALLEASRSAFAMLESSAEDIVGKASTELGSLASDAVKRSLLVNSADAVAEIEEATANSSRASREAAVQLRDQLAKVNELANNIEQRVERARALAEEQVDNDFSRRMALITESLNSNAIDIAKAFDTEVTDTAWTSYLKGDRGIFTRRAVNLVDNTEAREIVELYQNDDDFREHVSRYIHDFEAMLRSLLSTRDGNALSVTVLGSDMGKLYVALAQSIERLRS